MTARIPKEIRTKIEDQSIGSEFLRITVVKSTAKPKVERLMTSGRLSSLTVHAGANNEIDVSFEEAREKLKGGLIVQNNTAMNNKNEPPIAMNQKYRNLGRNFLISTMEIADEIDRMNGMVIIIYSYFINKQAEFAICM